MKKIICLLLSVFLLFAFASCTPTKSKSETTVASTVREKTNSKYKVKSIWITYYELSQITKISKTENEFSDNISTVFKELKSKGFNTVTIQVRPCADAFYKSSYFPLSRYCFGTEGGELLYDPLSVMTKVSHDNGLKIEAWINPYRVSQTKDINSLCDSNIAKKWYNDKKKKSNIYITGGKIFFNPASNDVIELIVNGVREIVKNYDVDAIHFDDYFYPTTDKKIDKSEYEKYKFEGNNKNLGNFRRDKVSELIKKVYSAVKGEKENVRFGISPCGNMNNNYNDLYADIVKWCNNDGYVDYICPQIYYGFKNETLPFMRTVKNWAYDCKCDIYIGLPLYKCGKVDEYAGEGENEFKNGKNIISRQIKYLNALDNIGGYYIFSYSSLVDKNSIEEVSRMYDVIESD